MSLSDTITDAIKRLDLDVVVAIRSFYLLVAAGIVFIYNIPALKSRFLAYGARSSSTTDVQQGDSDEKTPQKSTSLLDDLLDFAASLSVPHAWFIHFYTISIAMLLLWLGQIIAQGPILHFVLRYTKAPSDPILPVQVIIAWLAMLLTGLRRYIECSDSVASESKMFVGHYIMGMMFYLVTSVAVWIEGDRRLIAHNFGTDKTATGKQIANQVLDLVMPSHDELPNSKRALILLGLILFFYATRTQSIYHGHLRFIKTLTQGAYTLPNHPLFDYTVTPHYFAECVEYLGLALICAPPNRVFGTTMLCCLAFVVVNLGVTADGTRKWYRKRFGGENVEGKARMIPLVW